MVNRNAINTQKPQKIDTLKIFSKLVFSWSLKFLQVFLSSYRISTGKTEKLQLLEVDMGLVNTVVPLADLEAETVSWCREMLENSPMALRLLKASMNAADDGLAGIQQLAGDATLLFYLSEEGQEGRDAYKERRKPNFGKFPKRP